MSDDLARLVEQARAFLAKLTEPPFPDLPAVKLLAGLADAVEALQSELDHEDEVTIQDLADALSERDEAMVEAGELRVRVAALEAENEQLRERLDAAQLRSIEARNPGIDMDEVRAIREGRALLDSGERP